MAEGQANPTSSVGSGSPSTINLQFLSPSVQEVPGGRLNLPNVPLDIEIEALQRRISERLHSAPSPDRLRLIFYGRAMTDAKAKLRTYLNREVRPSIARGRLGANSASSIDQTLQKPSPFILSYPRQIPRAQAPHHMVCQTHRQDKLSPLRVCRYLANNLQICHRTHKYMLASPAASGKAIHNHQCSNLRI